MKIENQNSIFLSYAHEDKKIALKLFNDLTYQGLDVWIDDISLKVGQRWKPEIQKKIQQSRFFIALLSSNSVNKIGFVQKELRIALDQLDYFPESETYIIPIRIDDCRPNFERLNDIQWIDLFPSYQKGLIKFLKFFNSESTNFLVVILNEANEMEISNAIDIANSIQTSYKFIKHSKVITFDKNKYILQNQAINFDKVIDDLVKNRKEVQELLRKKPIFLTALPFSDNDLAKEYLGNPISGELSQCYFHEIYEFTTGNVALISTYIWDNMETYSDLNFPKSQSGRRVLQPYLLSEFASIALDPHVQVPMHEEIRGCPFDYCNKVNDIDEMFRVKKLCDEHSEFFRKEVNMSHMTKRQLNSALQLFDRSYKL